MYGHSPCATGDFVSLTGLCVTLDHATTESYMYTHSSVSSYTFLAHYKMLFDIAMLHIVIIHHIEYHCYSFSYIDI